MSDKTTNLVDWATDRVLRLMISRLLRLPYAERVPRFGQITRRYIGPLFGYTRRTVDNLAMIYPEMPKARREEIAAGVLDNFGRTIMEFQSTDQLTAYAAANPPTGAGLEVVAQAASEGRPVIFASAHFGNPEAARHALTAQGYQVGVLYRPLTNSYFNQLHAAAMESLGAPTFEQGRQGTMGFVRHLKRGGMALLYFDVAAGRTRLPFLGRPAKTATSLAEIAVRTDALVVPVFGIRQPDGLSFQVEIEAPVPHGPPEEMMLALNQRLEAQIARNPEQWFWVHRRWKGGKPA